MTITLAADPSEAAQPIPRYPGQISSVRLRRNATHAGKRRVDDAAPCEGLVRCAQLFGDARRAGPGGVNAARPEGYGSFGVGPFRCRDHGVRSVVDVGWFAVRTRCGW